MALTQGLFAALVADTSGEKNRGTAFGIYGLVTGIAILVASVIAGWLWDQFGPPVTFYAGACFSLITLVGIFTLRKRVEIL
jgi:MFS family permease